MTNRLRMQNGVLPIAPSIVIEPVYGGDAYNCERRFGMLRPGWDVLQNSRLCAQMKAKFGLAAQWKVNGEVGEFALSQRMLDMRNAFDVAGGPYDGATLKGSLLDRTFELEWNGKMLARASADVMSITDILEIEVLGKGRALELLAVICMLAIRAQRMKSEGLE